MKKFVYKAKDINGKTVKGTIISENSEKMKESLAKEELFVTSFRQVTNKEINTFFSISGKISISELSSFCKQFSVMISSGISIVDSLNTLKVQPYSKLLKSTLNKLIDDITNGLILSDAMKKYPKIFPNFFTSMVYVGETTGKLDKVLLEISDYYTRRNKSSKKIKSALAYPIVLLSMMLVVVVVMLNFVIPTFISTFHKMNIEMPAMTMILFNMSNFVRANWKLIILFVAFLVLAFIMLGKTKKGRYFYDMLKMKIPIAKKINYAVFVSKFTQSLGLLLNSGTDMMTALDTISNIIDNKYLEKQFNQVKNDVKNGLSLSNSLDVNMKLSKVLIQMVGLGEKTGSLGDVLLQTYDYFDNQVDNALNSITSIIQPIILILLGIVIGFMFIAIYSPILSMVTSLNV